MQAHPSHSSKTTSRVIVVQDSSYVCYIVLKRWQHVFIVFLNVQAEVDTAAYSYILIQTRRVWYCYL